MIVLGVAVDVSAVPCMTPGENDGTVHSANTVFCSAESYCASKVIGLSHSYRDLMTSYHPKTSSDGTPDAWNPCNETTRKCMVVKGSLIIWSVCNYDATSNHIKSNKVHRNSDVVPTFHDSDDSDEKIVSKHKYIDEDGRAHCSLDSINLNFDCLNSIHEPTGTMKAR